MAEKILFIAKSYVIYFKNFLKTIFFRTLPCNKVISIIYIFTFFVLVNMRCVKINDDLQKTIELYCDLLEAVLFQMNRDNSGNSIDLILVGKCPLSVIRL